jgi:hypothetical protein
LRFGLSVEVGVAGSRLVVMADRCPVPHREASVRGSMANCPCGTYAVLPAAGLLGQPVGVGVPVEVWAMTAKVGVRVTGAARGRLPEGGPEDSPAAAGRLAIDVVAAVPQPWPVSRAG